MRNGKIVWLFVTNLALWGATPIAAQTRDSTLTPPEVITKLIGDIERLSSARDSLTAYADSVGPVAHGFAEELIWQRHAELQASVLNLAKRVKLEQDRGGDISGIRQALNAAASREWPRYIAQLQRWETTLRNLNTASATGSGSDRLAIGSQMNVLTDRLLDAYRSLVDIMLALEQIGVDVSEPRAFLVERAPQAGEMLVARVRVAARDRASISGRLAREASNTDLRNAFDASDERFQRATNGLSTVILIMDRLGLETTDLRVALITATGRMNADVFKWKVFIGLAKHMWQGLVDVVAVKASPWLFQALLIVLTFLAFRMLARIVRQIVRHAVRYWRSSQLMRDTLVQLSSALVMLIGFVVILTQLGVQVAPLLAGLGIAGFIVGFAMQNTLSNFAAGAMILTNQPYDIDDEIEVAGVLGTVRKMSLVSTTILTPDNQTLIIPNNTIWGGVIRNRTAQTLRRVDLTFGIGYGDDIEKAERVLRDIVEANETVVKNPTPTIKLHALGDSSVNFVVRAWTAKNRYWDVYWDITRAVKLRFDAEGISIPFPQRDLHVKIENGQLT